MSNLDDLLKEFPDDTRRQLTTAWGALPAPMQQELSSAAKLLPGDLARWRLLLDLALPNFQIAFADKRSIAIVGPANVGKSTLYNQLVRKREDKAEVSPVPGTTRVNQEADAGLFRIVDTPGADAVGDLGEQEKSRALQAAEQADFLIVVFDAIQGIKRTEQELFDELHALGKPLVAVLNKADLLSSRDLKPVLERTAANLRLEQSQVVPISARTGHNLDDLLLAIAKAEPGLLAALGRALPAYRWRLAWTAITGAATTSAVIALTPLPVLDVIPLLAVQSSLVLGVARIYNYELTPARARELAVTFGLGFLGRTLFQELSKLGGPPGWALSAAVAAGTTVVMGYAAATWFERGEKLTGESLKRLTKAVTDTVLDSLRNFGKKRPDRATLQERIRETLERSEMGETFEKEEGGERREEG
ncbi:MAG: 50S ribosome-binding GTPase [Anaerolineales bacterium]|nr:50S ribosome-binding GTPase [Anaerolineales bacterium]